MVPQTNHFKYYFLLSGILHRTIIRLEWKLGIPEVIFSFTLPRLVNWKRVSQGCWAVPVRELWYKVACNFFVYQACFASPCIFIASVSISAPLWGTCIRAHYLEDRKRRKKAELRAGFKPTTFRLPDPGTCLVLYPCTATLTIAN